MNTEKLFFEYSVKLPTHKYPMKSCVTEMLYLNWTYKIQPNPDTALCCVVVFTLWFYNGLNKPYPLSEFVICLEVWERELYNFRSAPC